MAPERATGDSFHPAPRLAHPQFPGGVGRVGAREALSTLRLGWLGRPFDDALHRDVDVRRLRRIGDDVLDVSHLEVGVLLRMAQMDGFADCPY